MNKYFKIIPRWAVLHLDIFICMTALAFAYALRFNFEIPAEVKPTLIYTFPLVLFIKFASFHYTKSFAGLLSFSSIEDAKRIFKALTISALLLFVVSLVNRKYNLLYLIPVSVLFLDYFLSLLFMGSFRIVAKILYYESKGVYGNKRNAIIFGAGEAGIITKRTLIQEAGTEYKIVAFVDDNLSKSNSWIEGTRIYPADTLGALISSMEVELVIISIKNISSVRKKEIIDTCLSHGVLVRSIPPAEKWINGELSFRQIKEVKIEDLLERDALPIYIDRIEEQLTGKTILVTGAAGSIGSELARQIIKWSPKNIILLDQAESALYELEMELAEMPLKINFEAVIADVRNRESMENVYKNFHPEIVFHAAAYKHVPVLEVNPAEAVLTNILGSKIAADLALKYKVEKFIMISTDKAVNPTNIMGASKRVAEIYTKSLNDFIEENSTRFITTRFGNVVNSTGSVIPRFKKQISEGGPVTVTHPEIDRYFMTIPEACQLVLEAAVMGEGGEVFVFDMGKPVKILDLAKKMIRLSGLTLGKDIQIIYTGLRPGEKLYEELLLDEENMQPTAHPKIMVARLTDSSYQQISMQIAELSLLADGNDKNKIVNLLKQIVPEYSSSIALARNSYGI